MPTTLCLKSPASACISQSSRASGKILGEELQLEHRLNLQPTQRQIREIVDSFIDEAKDAVEARAKRIKSLKGKFALGGGATIEPELERYFRAETHYLFF